MNGSRTNCSTSATGDVNLYDQTNSSFGDAIEPPPTSDAQLGTIASQYGCLYSGPTQIKLRTYTSGHGTDVGTSPDTPEQAATVGGVHQQPLANLTTNPSNCPNDGTWVPLPSNGVVYVQNATALTTPPFPTGTTSYTEGSKPFDDYIDNRSPT